MNKRQRQNTLDAFLDVLRFRVWMVRHLLMQIFAVVGAVVALIYGLLSISAIFSVVYVATGMQWLYVRVKNLVLTGGGSGMFPA